MRAGTAALCGLLIACAISCAAGGEWDRERIAEETRKYSDMLNAEVTRGQTVSRFYRTS